MVCLVRVNLRVEKLLNWPLHSSFPVLFYLHSEGLILGSGRSHLNELGKENEYDARLEVKPSTYFQSISITHKGVKEIEEAHTEPDRPTEHFPPYSVTFNISGGEFSNSPFQLAGHNSSQSITLSQTRLAELKEIIQLLKDFQKHAAVSSKEELNADIKTMESQVDSPKPKIKIIKDALASAKTIMEGAAEATTAASPIIAKILSWSSGVS